LMALPQQVDEDLTQFPLVRDHAIWHPLVHSTSKRSRLVSVRRRNMPERFSHQAPQVDERWLDRNASRLDLGHLENVVDERLQMLATASDGLQYWRWPGAKEGSRSRSWVKPRMAFIGVRISCEMLARNALFARPARWIPSTSFAFTRDIAKDGHHTPWNSPLSS